MLQLGVWKVVARYLLTIMDVIEDVKNVLKTFTDHKLL